jgi:hygromycin-B 7''-O-kinase
VVQIASQWAPGAPLDLPTDGTVLVALAGERVIKLYPPFMREHFAYEQRTLEVLDGTLAIPTPSLIAAGEHQGWPYLVMSRLAGESLTSRWPSLDGSARAALLEQIGDVMRQVHAVPSEPLLDASLRWVDFLAEQRRGAEARQRRKGLPAHLIAELSSYLAQVSVCPAAYVILTGEYTPMNLFVDDTGLAGMFDFGDGLVGDPHYDWLGPTCFLAAGSTELQAALACGYGAPLPDRDHLLRLLLTHRYSNLPAQVALPDWRSAGDLHDLARRIWP